MYIDYNFVYLFTLTLGTRKEGREVCAAAQDYARYVHVFPYLWSYAKSECSLPPKISWSEPDLEAKLSNPTPSFLGLVMSEVVGPRFDIKAKQLRSYYAIKRLVHEGVAQFQWKPWYTLVKSLFYGFPEFNNFLAIFGACRTITGPPKLFWNLPYNTATLGTQSNTWPKSSTHSLAIAGKHASHLPPSYLNQPRHTHLLSSHHITCLHPISVRLRKKTSVHQKILWILTFPPLRMQFLIFHQSMSNPKIFNNIPGTKLCPKSTEDPDLWPGIFGLMIHKQVKRVLQRHSSMQQS